MLILHLPRVAALSLTSGKPGGVAVGVFTSDVCVSHDTGWFCPESPKRLEKLLADLRNEWQAEFFDSLQIFQPEVDVTLEQLRRVHSDEHLRTLESAFDRAGGFLTPTVNLDGDTVVSPGTRAACWRAAGLTVSAVDEVLSNTSSIRRAFVMVRPPGHHAEPTGAMGFCLLNHAMIGVAHAQAVHGLGKVAVLDFDVHMGNGCAAACWSDPTRLYASSHQAGIFPVGFSRYAPDGSGRAGEYSTILSCALPSGSGSAEFRSAWESQLLPAVREFAPECIFLNAGFDAHAQEDVASLALEDDDYYWITGVLFRSHRATFPSPQTRRCPLVTWPRLKGVALRLLVLLLLPFILSPRSRHLLMLTFGSFRASSVAGVAHHLGAGRRLQVGRAVARRAFTCRGPREGPIALHT